jgi:uncharacterized protein (DUF885 family)
MNYENSSPGPPSPAPGPTEGRGRVRHSPFLSAASARSVVPVLAGAVLAAAMWVLLPGAGPSLPEAWAGPPAAEETVAGVPEPRGSAVAEDPDRLNALIRRAIDVSIPTHAAEEYEAAAREYRSIYEGMQGIDYDALGLEDQVDYDILLGEVRSQIFEIDTVALYELHPVRYFALGQTNRLFIRPGAIADRGVRAAVEELRRLPQVLENGKANLTNPARVWTENAIYQAYYARLLLTDYVPTAPVDDPALRDELLEAAQVALAAVEDFEGWLESDLLPRSNRSPAWDPEWIEFYQFVKEELYDFGFDEMLRVAEEEDRQIWAEMEALADSIHPSGDLQTVWEVMLEEAPPWEQVIPMAQSFVDMASDWLRNEGSHVVTIPDYIDYGARLTPPMSRRTLSFGGATRGPDVAGRQSGYYILTPLEDRLTQEEKASRIRSYNPYWTNVISYHEWLGHNVQIAAAREHVTRPVRRSLSTGYFSQAWSFYLEKLLEDEGFFQDRFDHVSAMKHRMARLQMRMWRVQRILTKLKMAHGEMTFDEAVQAYVDRIGMEPTNAFIEVQRDSQTPRPPGREIIGERALLELRDEYERRMGEHYTLRNFNDQLLTYGDLTFRQIRRLMFSD